jgi:hypothetical protein
LLSIRGNASTVAVDPASQIAPVQPAEILGMVERISIDTRWRGRPIEGRRAGCPGGQNRLRRTRSSFLRCARNARSAGMGYLIDIGAAILLLASLSIAASFVPSKKALILTVGGIVAVVGAIVSYIGASYLQRQQEEQKLESVISKSQIELKDMQLVGDEIFKLTGKVQNHHPEATVAQITIEVEIRDCARRDAAGVCEKAGDLEFPLHVTIPPGEVRALAAYARLPNRRRVRELDWSYRVGEIVAAEDPF